MFLFYFCCMTFLSFCFYSPFQDSSVHSVGSKALYGNVSGSPERSGTYLIPLPMIGKAGHLMAWELFASKVGPVKLQVSWCERPCEHDLESSETVKAVQIGYFSKSVSFPELEDNVIAFFIHFRFTGPSVHHRITSVKAPELAFLSKLAPALQTSPALEKTYAQQPGIVCPVARRRTHRTQRMA